MEFPCLFFVNTCKAKVGHSDFETFMGGCIYVAKVKYTLDIPVLCLLYLNSMYDF